MNENKNESAMQEAKSAMNGKSPVNTEHFKNASHLPLEASMSEELSERYHAAKQMTTDAYETSVQQVKSNPVLSVTAAVAVGALAGYFLGRRNK